MAKTKVKKKTGSSKKAATKKTVSKKKTVKKKVEQKKKVTTKKASVTKKKVSKKVTPKVTKKVSSSKVSRPSVKKVAAKEKVKTKPKETKSVKTAVKKPQLKAVKPLKSRVGAKKITADKNTRPEKSVSVFKKVVNKAKDTLKGVTAIAVKKQESVEDIKEKSNKVATPVIKEVKPVNQADVIKDVVNILNSSIGRIKEDHSECPNCKVQNVCRRREFSEQALTVLLLWGEIRPDAVDFPICDDCYDDMREVLIDRAEEIETALNGEDVFKVREIVAKIAS